MKNIRETAVDNIFYPKKKNELSNIIKYYLKNTDIPSNINNIKGVVSPHAGYEYSGVIAAYSYKIIQQNWKNIPKTFVILAPSHYEYIEFASCGMFDEYETPLGNIEVDLALGNQLINDYADFFSFSPEAHKKEHSIETQLPFLKYISGGDDFKILPILVGNINPIELGDIFSELSKMNNLFFIVSSDLSHYKHYDDAVPIDHDTIRSFLSQDIMNIANNADACGIYPWLILNQISTSMNWYPKLIKYANSGDTSGGKEQVVGYASMVYIKKE